MSAPPARRGSSSPNPATGEVLTAGHVEAEIVRLSAAMDAALEELATYAVDAAQAEHAYKVQFAKEMLKAKNQPGSGPRGQTTDSVAEAKAIIHSDTELRERLVAEAFHGVTQEKLRTMRSQIDALRTISANIRAMT